MMTTADTAGFWGFGTATAPKKEFETRAACCRSLPRRRPEHTTNPRPHRGEQAVFSESANKPIGARDRAFTPIPRTAAAGAGSRRWWTRRERWCCPPAQRKSDTKCTFETSAARTIQCTLQPFNSADHVSTVTATARAVERLGHLHSGFNLLRLLQRADVLSVPG